MLCVLPLLAHHLDATECQCGIEKVKAKVRFLFVSSRRCLGGGGVILWNWCVQIGLPISIDTLRFNNGHSSGWSASILECHIVHAIRALLVHLIHCWWRWLNSLLSGDGHFDFLQEEDAIDQTHRIDDDGQQKQFCNAKRCFTTD